LSRSRKWNQ